MDTNSTLRAVEDWVELPYVREGVEICYRLNGDPAGERHDHTPVGHRDFYLGDASKCHALILKKGLYAFGKMGMATARLFRSVDLVDARVSPEEVVLVLVGFRGMIY